MPNEPNKKFHILAEVFREVFGRPEHDWLKSERRAELEARLQAMREQATTRRRTKNYE